MKADGGGKLARYRAKIIAAFAAGVFVLPGCAHQQPYAGLQSREIKALSPQEIDDYLSGAGMGFALAAELNGYPGPRHVLENAGELELSDSQLAQTRRLFSQMENEAKPLGRAVVDKERELDKLFSGGAVGEESLHAAVAEIAELKGRLRAAHLKYHLAMKALLSPKQLAKYESLRGYHQHHGRH